VYRFEVFAISGSCSGMVGSMIMYVTLVRNDTNLGLVNGGGIDMSRVLAMS